MSVRIVMCGWLQDLKMGNILNPGNRNSFARIVQHRDNGIFVDKTDFIGKTIERIDLPCKFIAMTRPRRFGKTVMAHMLAAYYSCGCDSRELFEGLKITRYESESTFKPDVCEESDAETECRTESLYEKYLNKCNVIYWDMNTVQAEFRGYVSEEEFYIKGIDDIVDYLQYATLSEIKNNETFGKILAETPMTGKKSLYKAITAISEALDVTFVLIMDEWDLIFREYRDDKQLQKKFEDLLKDLFKSDRGSSCFSLVYLTGILPVKKDNSQSGLNMFDEYSMLTPGHFAEYFGFTEDEVSEIVKSGRCGLTKETLKEWYDGYKVKDQIIYNPYSVVSAIHDGKCKYYWCETSSNEEFINLINEPSEIKKFRKCDFL